MAIYVVTNDQRLVRYDSPAGTIMWLKDCGDYYHLYRKNCQCKSCDESNHKVLIAYIQKSRVVSIGFERPTAIEGRLLTFGERNELKRVAEWLRKRKGAPKKFRPELLESIARLSEGK